MSRSGKGKDSFNHSPFKTLKGLSVSVALVKTATPVPAVQAPVAESDDRDLFAREMQWMEVRPLQGRATAPLSPATAVPAAPPVPTADDAAEFLAAVGRLDKRFADDIPPAEPPRARPRRMKQLERGELKPAGELDLHGLTRDEALERTRAYLAHAARQGWAVVLVVTGKGLRSSEGPVLRQAVERLLHDAEELVVEWGEAPRRFGGAGALAVFLRTAR